MITELKIIPTHNENTTELKSFGISVITDFPTNKQLPKEEVLHILIRAYESIRKMKENEIPVNLSNKIPTNFKNPESIQLANQTCHCIGFPGRDDKGNCAICHLPFHLPTSKS